MALTVTVITDWTKHQRRTLAEQLLSDAHPLTLRDMQLAKDLYNIGRTEFLDLFVFAARLAVVHDGEVPVFMFAIHANDGLSTISTSHRDRIRGALTKLGIRWIATDEGRAFLTGTFGYALADNVGEAGCMTAGWPLVLGYRPTTSFVHQGHTFQRYDFQGA